MTLLGLFLVSSALAQAPLEPRDVPADVYLDRAGFPELVIHNTFTGPIAGLALTQALFPKNQVRAVAGLPVGLGLGILLPIALTYDDPVHASDAALYNLGERWGLLTGPFVPALWSSGRARDYWGATALSFGAGLGAAIALERRLELSPGQISALGTGHLFGIMTGGLLMLSLDVVPDGRAAFAGPVLLFGNAGLAFAYLGREAFDVDRRRIILMDLSGLLGMAAGAGVGFLVTGGEDGWRTKPQIYGLSMLGGLVVGMGAAYLLSPALDEYKAGLVELSPPGPLVLPSADGAGTALGLSLSGRF